MLNTINISGFKSIKELDNFTLNNLNIIIGANGAGKSNFIQIFKLLKEMSLANARKYILTHGGIDGFLFNGGKTTKNIEIEFKFGLNAYGFELTPTANENFLFDEWRQFENTPKRSYGALSEESGLKDFENEKAENGFSNGIGHYIYKNISSWVVYHLHDTTLLSPMRRSESVEDNDYLRSDAANIAPFLLFLRNKHNSCYQDIINAIQPVIPFFDDFILDVQEFGEARKVKLSWRQKGSDFPMQPYHLSDGSIRFIALATVLLQPNPPKTIIIDEPELGLHPEAIDMLAELINSAAEKTQIIVATQSPQLINNFAVNDIIVAERAEGASTFRRLDEKDFLIWLEDYSIGELWQKDVIRGGPIHE